MKYSVIIPVYNAEKTIRRCVDSLTAEADADVEIILINDGSKDTSAEICRDYSDQFSYIRFIDKENGGVSTARNAGLDAASGDYVLFVDSDDYVLPGYFLALDHALDTTPCDLIRFSYSYEDGSECQNQIIAPFSANSRDTLLPHIIDAICRKRLNPPWAKLYRREIIEAHQIRFPVGASVAEDRAFNIHYSLYINSYATSDQMVYCVNIENENSLTRGRHADLKKQFDIVGQYIQNVLENADIPTSEKEQYRLAVNFGECRTIYHDAKLMHQDKLGWLQRQARLGRLCNEINQKHMKYPNTRYCTLITLPVRLYLTPVIDAIAWKLTH